MSSQKLLERGRRAVARRAWREAYDLLAAARTEGALPGQDLWLLAMAAYLVGEEEGYLDALRAAHQAFVESDDSLEAVRTAFWLGQFLTSRGEMAVASGWFARAARLVEDRGVEGAARGYALFPQAYRQFAEGRSEESLRTAELAAEIGRRCRDHDLSALATHLQGRALLRLGRVDEGLALLDEAMVGVTADELTPVASGLVYCSVIAGCRDVWALGRAQEWTAALTEWCSRQPDMIAYTGPCRVSRAEILQRRGAWSEALDEARLAEDRFARGSGPGNPGTALYQQGEVHRLLGELAAAERAYKAASEAGVQPQPGLALLRLAQGEAEAAAASLRRALTETDDPLRRARLLPAYVEILLETGDVEAARTACDEIDEIAGGWGGRVLEALSAQARGATLLASGDPERALPLLRRACSGWHDVGAPYEGGRVRLLLAEACARVGDAAGEELELDAARSTFERLGAVTDLARLREAEDGVGAADGHGLTGRELEVLGWLATGRTNKAIAKALSISEKTVARHVANIYAKLGLSTRAAATAYAYEHGLSRPST